MAIHPSRNGVYIQAMDKCVDGIYICGRDNSMVFKKRNANSRYLICVSVFDGKSKRVAMV